jgi:hypothetical protein
MTNTLSARGGLGKALTSMDGQAALVMVQQAYQGQVDIGGEPAEAWAALVDMAEQAAEDAQDIRLVSWARQRCYTLAESEEGRRWFLRAEQIWKLKQRRVTDAVSDVGDTAIIVGQDSRPLWAWGSDHDNWPDFCVDNLGLKPENARLLERMYDLYVVRMNLSMEEVLRRGKSKQLMALGLAEFQWENKGALDEDLVALLQEGSWHEVREYVRGVRNETVAETRQPLSYDGQTGKVSYWADDGLRLDFGTVIINDPPDDLDPSDKDKWTRRKRAIESTIGAG